MSFLLDLGAYVDGETEDLLEDRMPDLLAKKDLSKNRTNRDTAENRLFHALYDERGDGQGFVDKCKEAIKNNNNVRKINSQIYGLTLYPSTYL